MQEHFLTSFRNLFSSCFPRTDYIPIPDQSSLTPSAAAAASSPTPATSAAAASAPPIKPKKILTPEEQTAVAAADIELARLREEINGGGIPYERVQQLRADIAKYLIENITRVHPKLIKNQLHRLFLLRQCYQQHFDVEAHIARFRAFTQKYQAFMDTHIDFSPTKWRDPEVLRQFYPLYIESLMLTDELLAHAEHDIRKIGQDVNATTLAARLTHQGGDIYQEDYRQHELFARFMHESIFILYHYYRGEFSYIQNGSAKIFWFNIHNKMPHYSRANNPDVYANTNALPFQMRVMYNTFSKDGFFKYYNDKTDPKGELKKEIDAKDTRYSNWATVDTTKEDTFKPSYGNRAAAHSRVFGGGK